MIKRKCKITFIRHGATIYTDTDRLCDKVNYPPITEVGKDEMTAISQWVKSQGLMFDKIFCSPEARVLQSTRILSKICKQEAEIIPDLWAKRCGIWSGLSFDQIEQKYPRELNMYHNDRENYIIPNGESLFLFNDRISKTVDRIVEENDSSRLIIVTHGDIIQSCVARILKVPADYQTRIIIPTGSATQISYFQGWALLNYCGVSAF